METAVTAGAWVMAAVLGWAGLAKMRRPAGTGAALRLAGLPSATWLVRLLGAGECAVAAAVLLVGGRAPAVLLMAAYAAFSVFAAVGRRRPAASCGCFGDDDAPLTSVHVAVDVAGAATAAGAAVVAAPGLAGAFTGAPLTLGTAVAAVGVAAGLVTLVLTALPALLDATAASTSTPDPVREVGA